jgi:hypothetical protein
MMQAILCVGFLPDFKAVVVSSGIFHRTVDSAWRRKIGLRRAVLDLL